MLLQAQFDGPLTTSAKVFSSMVAHTESQLNFFLDQVFRINSVIHPAINRPILSQYVFLNATYAGPHGREQTTSFGLVG